MAQVTVELSKKESSLYNWIIIGCIIYILAMVMIFQAGRKYEISKQSQVDSTSYLLGVEAGSTQCTSKEK